MDAAANALEAAQGLWISFSKFSSREKARKRDTEFDERDRKRIKGY